MNLNHFIITNNQRKKEKKTKKYSKICRNIENKKMINVDNKKLSVSKISSKKTNYKKNVNTNKELKRYITNTEDIDKLLEDHYKFQLIFQFNLNI